MNEHSESWQQLLNPDILREKIISASMFLIAHEILIESIVGRIKFFFSDSYDHSSAIISESYVNEVLALNKSPVYASLEWLKNHNVIDDFDLKKFEKIKRVRNSLAHELTSIVTGNADFSHIETFDEVLELINKIEIWWIVNFEMAIDPDFDDKEIDEAGIVPGSIISIQMMLDVLSGNLELLNQYRKTIKQ